MAGSNMLIDENGLRIAAGGFVGAPLPVMAAGLAAASPILGVRNAGYIAPGQLVAVNRPIAISNFRLKFATDVTAFAAGAIRLQVFKSTCPVANFTGGSAVLAQRKKVSDYAVIPASEIDVTVSTGTTLLTPGNHTLQGTAIDSLVLSASSTDVAPDGECVWWPEDHLPLVVEQNEGLVVQATVPVTGTWTGFIGFDFFRF